MRTYEIQLVKLIDGENLTTLMVTGDNAMNALELAVEHGVYTPPIDTPILVNAKDLFSGIQTQFTIYKK